MGIGRPFQCLPANFVKLRQVLILALDLSSGPLTNFKGTFHKIPCSHSPLKVVIMSQKWLPLTLNKYCYVGSTWPWPIPIALPNSVKRIQGSESQVPAGLYCNLLLCGIKSLVLSRRPRSVITPVKPQLQPTFCHHHKPVVGAGRPPSLLA